MENFVGVVEDIFDPEKLGRVKVRVLGYHTEDKVALPTAKLPWSMVATPTTSPSISGLGHNSYLMLGSWVVGFWHDDAKQDGIVTGSIPGKPGEKRDKTLGFTDPSGVYPKWTDDSDLSYAAREEKFEEHTAFTTKTTNRVQGISKAVPPKMTSVQTDKADSYYERKFMDEPETAGGHRPEYPFNHVYETHGGHLEEFDDTPDNKRYHRYHPAGTYEEIYNDGSRTVKVIGKDYEYVMAGKDIFINGNCNLVVTGSMTHYVQGDYHLEVLRDYTINVHGSIQQKAGGNHETEVVLNRAATVGVDDSLFVSQNKNVTVGVGNLTTTVQLGNSRQTVNGSISVAATTSIAQLAGTKMTLSGGTTMNLGAGVNMDISSIAGNIIATTPAGVILLN